MILTKALKIRYTLIKAYLVEIWRWARIQLKRQKVVPSGCPRKKIGRKNPQRLHSVLFCLLLLSVALVLKFQLNVYIHFTMYKS